MKKYIFISLCEAAFKNVGKYQSGNREGQYYMQIKSIIGNLTYTIPLEFVKVFGDDIGFVVSKDYVFRVYDIVKKKNVEMSLSIFVESFELLTSSYKIEEKGEK